MNSYYYRGPSIDHSLLSPSGHLSARARKQAMAREAARLFPAGTFAPTEKTESEKITEKASSLRRSAQTLLELADRGMNTRKYRKAAKAMLEEAGTISNSRP